MHDRSVIPARLLAAICFAGLAAVPGCLTLEQMAPPVDPFLLSVAGDGAEAQALARGRRIYLEDCSRCHTIEPIGRYDPARWRSILSKMSAKSKLNPQQTGEVEAYVLTARASLDRPRPAVQPPPPPAPQ